MVNEYGHRSPNKPLNKKQTKTPTCMRWYNMKEAIPARLHSGCVNMKDM